MTDLASDKAVTQATSTFEIWKKTSYKYRSNLLRQWS